MFKPHYDYIVESLFIEDSTVFYFSTTAKNLIEFKNHCISLNLEVFNIRNIHNITKINRIKTHTEIVYPELVFHVNNGKEDNKSIIHRGLTNIIKYDDLSIISSTNSFLINEMRSFLNTHYTEHSIQNIENKLELTIKNKFMDKIFYFI